MKAEQITHYGKGIIERLPELEKLKKQLTFQIFKFYYQELGLIGAFKVLWKTGKEIKKLKNRNWTDFEKKHGFPEDKIIFFIEEISIMIALKDMVGEERAIKIISDMLSSGNEYLRKKAGQNIMLLPVNEFRSLKDSFTGFKDYIIALEKAVEADKFHTVDIVDDSKNSFGFHVKSCLAYELAKELGDSKLCFFCCHLDDVVFPRIGPEIGFQYSRPMTMPDGGPLCDFRFDRI